MVVRVMSVRGGGWGRCPGAGLRGASGSDNDKIDTAAAAGGLAGRALCQHSRRSEECWPPPTNALLGDRGRKRKKRKERVLGVWPLLPALQAPVLQVPGEPPGPKKGCALRCGCGSLAFSNSQLLAIYTLYLLLANSPAALTSAI
jgi:hypothetical protein